MKIVIVEDEIRIREGISKLVCKLNEDYEVVGEASNGEEGLKLICSVQPDVIITDIKMPMMDGLEMLNLLADKGIKAKTIVLSAYSEFEYARQAMRLGVKEYLLKPIVVGEISDSLQRVSEEIRKEKEQPEDLLGSKEQIFAGILAGTLDANEKMSRKLSRYCGVPENAHYQGICLYMGSWFDTEKDKARRELEGLLLGHKIQDYVLLEMEREKILTILIYQEENFVEMERWMQYWFLQGRRNLSDRKIKGVLGFIPQMHLEEIKEGMETLFLHMDWNLSLGDGVMISYPKIMKLQTNPCIYPLEIEDQMKLAVCAGEREKLKDTFRKFRKYFNGDRVYHPKEIKECHVRFLWAFMNVAKEVDILEYEELEQQKLLERIMGAKMEEELDQIGELLLEKLREDKETVLHLTVKRAQSMIQEFYQNGITLEEIAARLDLTPEYLGTRFHQEMGITFSAYIKNYRIKKAKELLIGTNLKLYEIADRVGYSDAKYFSRVFKETTGQLPADYRKTHK